MSNSETQSQQSIRNHRLWAIAAILAAIILWGMAVALPVWDTRSERDGGWGIIQGIQPAVLGFIGIIALCPAWFANLLLIPLFVMLFKNRRGGFVLSLIALAVAATAYCIPAWYGDDAAAVFMRRLVGFYLWLGSFVVIALSFAFLANPVRRKWIFIRLGVVMLMVLSIAGLEKIYPVGASPLEMALKDPNDLTPLTSALSHNPSQADKDSALIWALLQDLGEDRGPSKRMTMLIAAGASPNASDKFGETILMKAARRARSTDAFVKLLVQAGANVNAQDSRGRTVLDNLMEVGSSPECQKILVDAGARPSEQK